MKNNKAVIVNIYKLLSFMLEVCACVFMCVLDSRNSTFEIRKIRIYFLFYSLLHT